MQPENRWISRLAKFAVIVTFSLIYLGGMVTSLNAGLSVPDWPTSFGYNMFTFPVSKWEGGIWWEHSHRLVASFLGLVITVLAVWIWRVDSRRWVRGLGLGAFVLVVVGHSGGTAGHRDFNRAGDHSRVHRPGVPLCAHPACSGAFPGLGEAAHGE